VPAALTRRRFLAALPVGLAAASLLAACGGAAQVTTGAATTTGAIAAPGTTAAAVSSAATSTAAASSAATSTVVTSSAATSSSVVQPAATSAAVSKAGAPTITYMSNLPDTHPEGKARLGLLAEYSKTNPADHKQAAARVALWLNAPHAQAQMCIQATSLPVSNAAFQSKELRDYLKTDPQLKGFVDMAPHGWRWPALPSYAKISGALNKTINDIFAGKVSIQDGLTQAQQAAQVLLDQDLKLQ
jgi:hypothetical protein